MTTAFWIWCFHIFVMYSNITARYIILHYNFFNLWYIHFLDLFLHFLPHQSIYLSIYPSIHLSIYPSIHLSMYLSIHHIGDQQFSVTLSFCLFTLKAYHAACMLPSPSVSTHHVPIILCSSCSQIHAHSIDFLPSFFPPSAQPFIYLAKPLPQGVRREPARSLWEDAVNSTCETLTT